MLLDEAASVLSQTGYTEPRRLARRLVASVLDLTPAELLSHSRQTFDEQQTGSVRLALNRMGEREPLSRILAHREFWGLDFGLSPDTLDPRPDTETVVEAVLRRALDRETPLRFLDLGTGTGCILLALLSEFPAAAGFGVDDEPGAAITARRNALALGLGGRAHFLTGDWGTALIGTFDVVVANPPYITRSALADLPREVALYDPRHALDGGADGLGAYRSIAVDLPELLKPGAVFACEVGMGQAPAVAEILRATGLAIEGCERDLAGIVRCVVARAPIGGAESCWNAPPSRLGWRRSGGSPQ
jgi:release factor glutamine methyltransferase